MCEYDTQDAVYMRCDIVLVTDYIVIGIYIYKYNAYNM